MEEVTSVKASSGGSIFGSCGEDNTSQSGGCILGSNGDDIKEDIKNNAWITVNKDFFGQEWGIFANDFHKWQSHEWKSLANHITSDQKIVIPSNKCTILFLTHYYMS